LEGPIIRENLMRAIYLPDYNHESATLDQEINIDGDKAKHLIRVIRIKLGDQVLVLNGRGFKAISEVSSIEKKTISLIIKNIELEKKEEFLDIAVACPKRDAFEEIVRASVELGVSRLIPLYSQFSQLKEIQYERLERIIESGIIQSNNPFILPIEKFQGLSDFLKTANQYDHAFYLNYSDTNFKGLESLIGLKDKKVLLILGPEAGFSEEEELEIKEIKGLQSIPLSKYILRSPTAAIAGIGLLFSASFS
jgi:16S rRNA (uracil1498-N3)-methyltransferase